MMSFQTLIVLCGAYLIGSVPTGFIVARLAGIPDIRLHGSGNSGATNVARVLGKKFFALVLLLDAGKAFGYLFSASFMGASYEVLCLSALALLLGNSVSLFLRFGGGKGVATTVGALAYFSPSLMFCAFGIWVSVLIMLRNVGIASVCAAISLIIIALSILYKQNDPTALTIVSMAVWVIFLHRKNIEKYLNPRLD